MLGIQGGSKKVRKSIMVRKPFSPIIASVLLSLFIFTGKVIIVQARDQSTMKDKSTYQKPTDEELQKQLSPLQYKITQQCGTEKPFDNEYWNLKSDGIYVDVVSGEALFSSLDKYDSGSGWPSFTKPLNSKSVKEKMDKSLNQTRIEIRSQKADSHLGHVFDDGPKAQGGKRYCMNSAALRFVPVEELAAKGLGQYLFLFAEKKGWEVATLAGGCFWGLEDLIKKIPGVIETQVGYTGGASETVGYEQVKTGKTGHAESVQILFDPKKVSYEAILLQFFKMHDPTTVDRQGNDVGSQYRSAIFVHSPQQKKLAEAVKTRVNLSGKWGKPIVTQIVEFKSFVRGEDYHQDYLEKHPAGYTCHFIRKIDF